MDYSLDGIRHPDLEDSGEWQKWRLAYEGGQRFLTSYLRKLSDRETDTDFTSRKAISYAGSFAKAAINDIKNAIFQRMVDITRMGQDQTYSKAVNGISGGVDMKGSSMNSFIGRKILPEMLVMRRVGVWVDMPPISGETIADSIGKRPYLYCYPIENIRSWAYDHDHNLTSLLLVDQDYSNDSNLKLPTGTSERYRYVWLDEQGYVNVQYYVNVPYQNKYRSVEAGDPIKLKLKKIPFVEFEISESLMKDVADIQISLTNISSADLGYISKASYPVYVEQFDPRTEQTYMKPPADFGDEAGTAEQSNMGRQQEVAAGPGQGRRVPIGTEMPMFIHPSSEPLRASMEKQTQLKREIRELVNLSVMNANAQSAESKDRDTQNLETGLSFIGLVLENGERQIAEHWAAYLNADIATINYPRNYSVKTELQRQEEAEGDESLMSKIPSTTFKKEMAKKIASNKLGNRVSYDVLAKIHEEIESAPAIVSDPDQIHQDWEDGLVSTKTASTLRGYDAEKEVPIAEKEHIERITEIAKAQMTDMGQARGVLDGQGNQPTSTDEKQNKKQRGDGKKIQKESE